MKKTFFQYLGLFAIIILSLSFLTVITNIKINRELNWGNIFDEMSLMDFVFSWPGLVSILVGVYVCVGVVIIGVRESKTESQNTHE